MPGLQCKERECARSQRPSIFTFLACALKGDGRLSKVGGQRRNAREMFRTDAQAEGNQIWLGVWALDHDDKKKCRWFSEQLTHDNAPWLFAAGECYRQIASRDSSEKPKMQEFETEDKEKWCVRASPPNHQKRIKAQ